MAFGNIGGLHQIATRSITPTDAFTPFAKGYQLSSAVAEKRNEEMLKREGLLGIQELQQEAQTLNPGSPNYPKELSSLMIKNADLFSNPHVKQAAAGIFSVLEDAGRLQAQDQRTVAYQNYLNQKSQQNGLPLSPSSSSGNLNNLGQSVDGGLALPDDSFEAPILSRQQQKELDTLIDKKNKAERELDLLLENGRLEADPIRKKQLDDKARLKVGEFDDLLSKINRFGFNEPQIQERFPRSKKTTQGLYGSEFNRTGKAPAFRSVAPTAVMPNNSIGGINLGQYTGSQSNVVPSNVSAPLPTQSSQPAQQDRPALIRQKGVLMRFDAKQNTYVPL